MPKFLACAFVCNRFCAEIVLSCVCFVVAFHLLWFYTFRQCEDVTRIDRVQVLKRWKFELNTDPPSLRLAKWWTTPIHPHSNKKQPKWKWKWKKEKWNQKPVSAGHYATEAHLNPLIRSNQLFKSHNLNSHRLKLELTTDSQIKKTRGVQKLWSEIQVGLKSNFKRLVIR